MTSVEIITLFITILCLVSFCSVFTILFRHYFMTNIDSVSSGKEDIELIDNAIDEEEKKKSKTKKALRLTGKILSYVVLGIVFSVFVFAIVGKIKDDAMLFGNSTAVVIASGSMSEKNNEYVKNNDELNNQFDTYDIIGVSKYSNQDEVSLYDVVAYKNKKNITIIHRIVKVTTDDKGNEVYLTQGDSNMSPDNIGVNSQYDGYLTYDRIIGMYNGTRVKGLGVIVIFLQSPAGIVTVISIVYCLLMFDYYSNKFKKAIEERTDMLVNLIDYDIENKKEDDVVTRYSESLFYKDSVYYFEDGEYRGKENSDGIEKVLKNHMILIKKVDGKNTITITNTKTNEVKAFDDVSDDDIKNPEKFIPADELKEDEEDDEDDSSSDTSNRKSRFKSLFKKKDDVDEDVKEDDSN